MEELEIVEINPLEASTGVLLQGDLLELKPRIQPQFQKSQMPYLKFKSSEDEGYLY